MTTPTTPGFTAHYIEDYKYRFLTHLPEPVAVAWLSHELPDHKYQLSWDNKGWVCLGHNPAGYALAISNHDGNFYLYIEG